MPGNYRVARSHSRSPRNKHIAVVRTGVTLFDLLWTSVLGLLAAYLPELQLRTLVAAYLFVSLVSKWIQGY